MQKHHTAQFKLITEELAQTGIVEIKRRHLYLAYDKERLSKSVWLDLLDKVAKEMDVSEQEAGQHLKIFEPGNKDSVFLIYEDDDWPITPLVERT